MQLRRLVWIGMFVGSTIGGLVPQLWGAGPFSFSAIFLSTIGGVLGIWFAYRLTR